MPTDGRRLAAGRAVLGGGVPVGYDSEGAETERADLDLQGDRSMGLTTVVAPIGLPVEDEGGSGGGPR